MLKVFLVEDECIVREGIKNNMDWTGEGFLFCGEAADGELAFPLIQKEQPDIIITDIRMPFMNGLELSRLVKKALPHCKIIILSGHEEFSYAQEAIKIGITEYLLKPINSTELLKVVKRVAQEIMMDRTEKENYQRYRREMEETETDMKRRLFNEIIEGTLSIAEILERGKELELDLSAQCYQIALLKYQIKGGDETYSGELLALGKELAGVMVRYGNIIAFDRAIEGVALLVKGDSPKQIEILCERFTNDVKDVFDYYPQICYFGGIGTCVSRLTHLCESFESAARAFAHRFILNQNTIIKSSELTNVGYGDCDFAINTMALDHLDFKKVDAFLSCGEADEMTIFVDEFLKSISKTSEQSFLLKQYVLMNVYYTVFKFLKEIGETEALMDENPPGVDQIREMLKDPNQEKHYLTRILSIAIKSRELIRTKRYHRMIEHAKEYIHEHYADENISLNETAAFVNFSPSHFSTIFSRETGSSFIKYLTDLRMNKAKELLKCTDLRCSDISLAVGYKDPHYFSYLFKKAQNCTPMQYRTVKSCTGL